MHTTMSSFLKGGQYEELTAQAEGKEPVIPTYHLWSLVFIPYSQPSLVRVGKERVDRGVADNAVPHLAVDPALLKTESSESWCASEVAVKAQRYRK